MNGYSSRFQQKKKNKVKENCATRYERELVERANTEREKNEKEEK